MAKWYHLIGLTIVLILNLIVFVAHVCFVNVHVLVIEHKLDIDLIFLVILFGVCLDIIA